MLAPFYHFHRFRGLGFDSAASSRTETQGLIEVMLWTGKLHGQSAAVFAFGKKPQFVLHDDFKAQFQLHATFVIIFLPHYFESKIQSTSMLP